MKAGARFVPDRTKPLQFVPKFTTTEKIAKEWRQRNGALALPSRFLCPYSFAFNLLAFNLPVARPASHFSRMARVRVKWAKIARRGLKTLHICPISPESPS